MDQFGGGGIRRRRERQVGPEAPQGKERNSLATVPARGYFAILRLYGPTEPALAKTWKPGDFAEMK